MSADRITIRGYREDDKEECCHLWLELTEWHRQIYSDPSIGGEDPGCYFEQHVKKIGPHRIWVAESKEVVVGLVGLMENDEGLEIEPIVIKKEYRQKGIGKMLLQFAIRKAEKAGVNFVSIKPVIRNTEAIRLFQKVGFECVGRIELFMDLRKEERGEWKSDLNLLGLRFHY